MPHGPKTSNGRPVLNQAGVMGDPRVMLCLKSRRGKVNHITDFLSERTKLRRKERARKDVVISTDQGDQVVFRTDDSHPYKGITVGKWGAAKPFNTVW